MFVLFCVLLCITTPIVLLLTRTKPHEKRLRERLDALVVLDDPAPSEDDDLGLTKESGKSFTDRLTQRVKNYAAAQNLEKKLQQAGWNISVGKFLVITAAASLAAAFAAHLFIGQLLALGGAVVVGAAAPFGLLRWKTSRRLKKFSEALPDAIDLMSRALKAGHSTASAIEVIAQQSPDPVGAEFGKCAQEQRFGIPFRDALEALSKRVPSQDLHFLITAILVQKETGGDLTEILDRTTVVIRDRVRIQGEIRTHTAQGRLTGWILSGLPVGLLGVISVTSPSYTHVLFYDPMGQKLLYAAGGMITIGGFVIRRIVDIKV